MQANKQVHNFIKQGLHDLSFLENTHLDALDPDKAAFIGVVKVGLSKSKKTIFICFNNSTSKLMKYAFYFIWKSLFVLKIFEFLSWL